MAKQGGATEDSRSASMSLNSAASDAELWEPCEQTTINLMALEKSSFHKVFTTPQRSRITCNQLIPPLLMNLLEHWCLYF